MQMAELLPNLQSIILSYLNGHSLARAEVVCQAFRDATKCEEQDLWRDLVLRLWSWLLHDVPCPYTWKWLFSCLEMQTHAKFCIVGSGQPTATGVASGARAYTLATGKWTDFPAPAQETSRVAGLLRLLVLGSGFALGLFNLVALYD